MTYHNEEIITNWTRGDLHGEWSLSSQDIECIFGPGDCVDGSKIQKLGLLYAGNDSMLPHMMSNEALKYNADYRNRQVEKMHTLPWDVNMLNAFHNLHFTLYMADMLPDFVHTIDDGKRVYKLDIPGRTMWILQLVMKAATECLRNDYIKVSSKTVDAASDHRITPLVSDEHWSGLQLHVVADAVISVMTRVEPYIKANGIFGCSYKVDLGCETWDGDPKPLSRVDTRLKRNMVAMCDYISKELARFSKLLFNAEFNQPDNALFNLNAR